jgi:hypothetical protein
MFVTCDMRKPILNKRIFWDVDVGMINYDQKAAFVVERVFERGDVEDIREIRRYYGDEITKKILLNCRYLPEIRLYLAAAIFNERPENFKCYTPIQSMKALWPF